MKMFAGYPPRIKLMFACAFWLIWMVLVFLYFEGLAKFFARHQ